MGDDHGNRPLSSADLYGPSGHTDPVPPVAPTTGIPEENHQAPRDAAGNLVYEETPVIEPVAGSIPTQPQKTENDQAILPDPLATPELPVHDRPRIPEHTGRKQSVLRPFAVFIVIFVLGIAASVLYRNILTTFSTERDEQEEGVAVPSPLLSPGPPLAFTSESQPEASEASGWVEYTVWRSEAKPEVRGVTYRLPPGMREPVCDGTGCVSAGSYMPGGTRFTVAYYKKNIMTPQFSETQVTDASGRNFETREATVSSKPALEFTGTFAGSTTGGYRFSRMTGVMIAAGPETTIEVNHFSPSGVNSDFEQDNELFRQILATFSFE